MMKGHYLKGFPSLILIFDHKMVWILYDERLYQINLKYFLIVIVPFFCIMKISHVGHFRVLLGVKSE